MAARRIPLGLGLLLRACEKIKTVSRKVAKAPRIPKNSWLSFLLLGVFATLREIFSQTLSLGLATGVLSAQQKVSADDIRLGKRLLGPEWTAEKLKGQVILVEFWGTQGSQNHSILAITHSLAGVKISTARFLP